MDDNSVKYCPLMLGRTNPGKCLGDRCAWWLMRWSCAVTVMAACMAIVIEGLPVKGVSNE